MEIKWYWPMEMLGFVENISAEYQDGYIHYSVSGSCDTVMMWLLLGLFPLLFLFGFLTRRLSARAGRDTLGIWLARVSVALLLGYALLLSAVILLVCGTLTFSGLMVTSQAFRTQVIAVITQVFQEFTEFRFSAREETARRAGDVALTYLPEGMEEIRRSGNHISLHIFFEDATGNTMRLTHTVIGDKTSHVSMLDTEDAEVEQFYIQGEQATAISKGLDHTILWTSGNSVYLLTGTIATDELKLVAAGVQ